MLSIRLIYRASKSFFQSRAVGFAYMDSSIHTIYMWINEIFKRSADKNKKKLYFLEDPRYKGKEKRKELNIFKKRNRKVRTLSI